ncbi:MAG: XRE family transcriptional regulator [Bacillus sp. (in: Bacteria)]|nr:XRE family transcriptional regulator [Bacillus sp. (in: firmicutes)]
MINVKAFNGERLKSARIYRGLGIAELAELADVSKQAISQFENGKNPPGLETLLKLIAALGFPREYFYEQDSANVKVGNTYFRAMMTTNKKDRLTQIQKTKFLAQIYHFLNGYLEFPKLNIPVIDSFTDIEELASKARDYWSIGSGPIPNMVNFLEKNGFIVTSFSTDINKIDAFSQRQEINGQEYYFVVLGNDKNTAARRQFDAAHELGHIILHEWNVDLEQISREEFRQIEQEANQFAAAFLLPKDSFLEDLNLSFVNNLDYYVELKKKWKVSIQAMIVRAYHLKAINYNQYQNLLRGISKRGWRTNEPLDNAINVPKPSVLKKAIDVLVANKILDEEQLLEQLGNSGLPMDRREVEMLLGLEKGMLIKKDFSIPIISIKERSIPKTGEH